MQRNAINLIRWRQFHVFIGERAEGIKAIWPSFSYFSAFVASKMASSAFESESLSKELLLYVYLSSYGLSASYLPATPPQLLMVLSSFSSVLSPRSRLLIFAMFSWFGSMPWPTATACPWEAAGSSWGAARGPEMVWMGRARWAGRAVAMVIAGAGTC